MHKKTEVGSVTLPDNTTNKGSSEASLARLVQTFMPYIQKKARSVSIAGLDEDDLVQEGLIGLFRALEHYDSAGGAQFSTYAITCINNCITTAVRQAARKKHLPLSAYLSLEEEDAASLSGGYTPEEFAIAAEGYATLRSHIHDVLSDFERDVLALYLDGYDYLAVAKRLGTTPKSVDNALQRARKKLKSKQ